MRKAKAWKISVLLLVAAVAGMAVGGAKRSQSRAELHFGVFPYIAPRVIEKIYAPIGAEFSHVLNREIQFRTASSYTRFMKNLNLQMYDIVFVQPFDYVEIADKYGYKPLATRDKKLPAVLVVKADSKLNGVRSLRGKAIGLPPKVAAISYMVKSYLKRHGLVPGKDVTIKHFRSHGSCMHNVLVGSVAVCGTAPPAVRVFQSRMKVSLRVIARTPSISNSLFAVHPRVPRQQVELLRKAILSWPNSEKGRRLLKGAKVKAFIEVDDAQYNDVRKMAVEFRR